MAKDIEHRCWTYCCL